MIRIPAILLLLQSSLFSPPNPLSKNIQFLIKNFALMVAEPLLLINGKLNHTNRPQHSRAFIASIEDGSQ